VDTLLQPLGDWQVERVDDVAAVRLGRCFAPDQEIVDLPDHEVAVAFQVLLVDVQASRDRKKRSNLAALMMRMDVASWRPGSTAGGW
jgi:hypothetical protein